MSYHFYKAALSLLLFFQTDYLLVTENSESLKAWLSAHAAYRRATIIDCKCAGALKLTGRDNPYRVVGDFDGDGKSDEQWSLSVQIIQKIF